MKTDPARDRPVRRRSSKAFVTIAAVTIVAGASMSCAHQPSVSAPVPTLAAQNPTPTDPAPNPPEYYTELDLSEEEKEAVDGALVAFAGYIETVNTVFSSGGKDLDGVDRYARAEALNMLNKDADILSTDQQYMAGKYGAYNVQVESVGAAEDDDATTEVSILFCNMDSEWSIVDLGEPLPSTSLRGVIMWLIADDADGEWKIAQQYLRSKTC